jgi:hypothetical protein
VQQQVALGAAVLVACSDRTGSNMVPAFYIMGGAVVGLLGTLPLRR